MTETDTEMFSETDEPMAKGRIVWLMGPTSAGKTTIAEIAVETMRARGIPAIHFDGDEVRDFFGPEFGFEPGNRLRVVSTLAHLANKSADAGLHVIVAALTAHEDARAHVLETVRDPLIGFVKCGVDICAKRDPKGLYERARNGEISTLIGYNTEYNAPDNPDFILDTENDPAEKLAERVIQAVTSERPTDGG